MEQALQNATKTSSKVTTPGRTPPQPAPAHPMLDLNAQVGNRAIQQLLRSGAIQAKLAISHPDDPDEREADLVAGEVMRSPAQHCACEGSDEPCEECRQKAISVQRWASGPAAGAGHAPAIVERVLRSPGRLLDSATRRFFEPRFGRRFDDVRVHTGPEAQESARAIQANAYTAGDHVVFADGQYSPDTEHGKQLLAHELTHVVQQSRSLHSVHRQFLFNIDEDLGENPSPEDLYSRFYTVYRLSNIDKAADYLAGKLHAYVLAHPEPYSFIRDLFKIIPSSWEDNVAAAFVALLNDLELDRFAATDEGRAVLDILYDAMITGDVSGFERAEAARIEQYGLEGARKRQSTAQFYAFTEDQSTPESLVDRLRDSIADGVDVDTASEDLARKLRAQIDRRPDPYAFLRAVFEKLPDEWEDNVAAELVAAIDNTRLNQFAASQEGLGVLDILYDALITGDVSAFERYEAERIIQVRAGRTSLHDYEAYQGHPRIFPVKYQRFLRDCYAPLKAELSDGMVKVKYNSVRIYECSEFRKDIDTLKASFGISDTGLLDWIPLKPDELVTVRLYDDNEKLLDMPAIGLIDFANESKNRTLALAEQSFVLGLTIATIPLGGLPEAGLLRLLAIADRVAWGIALVSSLVNLNRDWIAELPYGKDFLEAMDAVNRLAGYYGWARLGVEGLRFAGSKIRPAWQAWRAAPRVDLSDAHAAIARDIDTQVGHTLEDIANAEKQATAGVHPDTPAAEPRTAGEPHESAGTVEGAQPAQHPAEPSLADVAKAHGIPPGELETEVRELIETPDNVAEAPQNSKNDAEMDAEGHHFERDKQARTWCRHSDEACDLELGNELNEKVDGRLVEKRAVAQNREYWKGKETPTTFARHKQKFTSLAKSLQSKVTALGKKGLQGLLPRVDTTVLDMPVDRFIADRGSPELQAEAARLQDHPDFIKQFGAGRKNMGAGLVGARETDIVEFFLDEREVVITDITLDPLSAVHQFKSRFYKEVLENMLSGSGISVFAHDINPISGISSQVIHD
ncbi:MAG TPA: DUF4157 domain-containing protein [Bryobacteraceae bacterium]|nr:DUF4157 domain-containing protein [Bryobacteraceae bacterium]